MHNGRPGTLELAAELLGALLECGGGKQLSDGWRGIHVGKLGGVLTKPVRCLDPLCYTRDSSIGRGKGHSLF